MKHSKKFWKQLTIANDSVESLHKTISQVLDDIGGETQTSIRIRDELFAILGRLECVGDEFYDLEQDIDGGE